MKLKKGKWIDTPEGIGQVLFIRQLIVEPFDDLKVIEDEGKSIGDSLGDIIVYKLLCNYEGKLRKRDITKSYNSEMCDPVSKESMEVINNIKINEADFYEKYCALEYEKNKPIKAIISFGFVIKNKNEIKRIEKEVKAINKAISKPFTFHEIEKSLNDIKLSLLEQDKGPANKQNILFQLVNDHYLTNKNNERLFSKIDMIKK